MKAQCSIISLLSLLPAVASSSLAAIPPEFNHPMVYKVTHVTGAEGLKFSVGDSRGQVVWLIGSPSDRISETIWVYNAYRGDNADSVDHRCDTLIVGFENRRVSSLALMNRKAVKALTPELRANPKYLASFLNNATNRALSSTAK